MIPTSTRMFGLSALALALVVGCSETPGSGANNNTSGQQPDPIEAPPFPEGTGQLPVDSLEYPSAPYGIGVGSVIENFEFYGFANAMVQNDDLEHIELAMFYNPTGDGVYPEGSPFGAGNPKPKALLINVASVWCGPCNYEADTILPVEYAKYKPLGGEFFLQLADGATPGVPAKETSLRNWTNKYDVDYPSSIDPSYKLGALFEADAFPANLIVDTRTMKIVDVIAGAPEASFWTKFENVLEGN
jgi:hypothetical protein